MTVHTVSKLKNFNDIEELMKNSPELRKLFVASFTRFINDYTNNFASFQELLNKYETRDKLVRDLEPTQYLKGRVPACLEKISSLFVFGLSSLLESKLLIDQHTKDIDKETENFLQKEDELYEHYLAFCKNEEIQQIFNDELKLNDAIEEFYDKSSHRFLFTSYIEIETLKNILKNSIFTPLDKKEFNKEIEKLMLTKYSVLDSTSIEESLNSNETLKDLLNKVYSTKKSKKL